jgi:DNA topoisomerase-1
VRVTGTEFLAKETQPPGRYGQGRLIRLMEDLGLGTKATRPSIIQNLYDRGYVHDDPLVPTETGIAVAQALTDFASEIATHEMTAELERSMDEISEGKVSKENVVDRSRDVLRQVYGNLESSEEEFADIGAKATPSVTRRTRCPRAARSYRSARSVKVAVRRR